MKYALLISIFIFIGSALSAQKDTAFIYTFGGEKDEQGRDIELTADSGFIMVGSTSSFGAGNSDIYLVKVDSNINHQWSAAIGHQYTEFGHAVKQTADKGYIICGYTNSIGAGNYDAYLVKTDSVGKLEWEQTYGGFGWDFAYDVEVTPDGGYLLVGETHSLGAGNADAYLIKTDKDGVLEWEKTMGGAGKDIAHALIATKDGNYAFCGENASKNPENKGDAWLVKFDGNGDTLFDRSVKTNNFSSAHDLTQDSSRNFYLIGYTLAVNNPIEDIEVVSLDKVGNYRWTSFQGGVNQGTANKNDRGYAITIDLKGNIYLSGVSETSGNGLKGMYIGHINSNIGEYIAGPTFGEALDEIGYSVLAIDNQILSFGYTNSYGKAFSDFYLVSIPNDTLTQEYIINTEEIHDTLTDVISSSEDTKPLKSTSFIYPNPTNTKNGFTCINCTDIVATELSGREVYVYKLMENRYTIESKGIYIISFHTIKKGFETKILVNEW